MMNPGNVKKSFLKATIKFTRSPSLIVQEGEELPIQPAIKLYDALTGDPIKGVGCMVTIKGINNDTFPKGYRVDIGRITIFIR